MQLVQIILSIGVLVQTQVVIYICITIMVAAQTVTGSTTMYANNWYHCVLYKDNSGNIKFYLNGVQDASATVSGTLRLVLVLTYG